MGKNRSASGITNVIQYDNNGNITFVSGSTTLMQVSSSGAITTTGVISGSNALSASFSLNSALLNGTGSVGFATTASLLTVSSSQQQISASLLQVSASYISLSGSYNLFSGSASTRITVDSASLLQVSSSQQQISASLLNVISIFATTGSNSFRANQSITGSLVVSSTITAQTLVVQTVTSSIVYSSGSNIFGSALADRQTFTGSVNITGSLTIAGASSATSYNGATIFGSTIACSPIGCFTTSCATSFIGGTMSGTTIYGSTAVCSPIGCFATSCATSFIGGTMSGTTIYGSTAVCSPVGKFTSCIDVGSGTFSGTLNFAQPVGLGFANGQYIKDNGNGGLFINSGAAINITATSVTFSSSVHKLNVITLGGVFSTGTSGVACRSIETAYALASCRTSVTKGVQYANLSWYNLFYASQDVYMHYKILLTCASYFAVSAQASNAQDGTDRTFKVQYSYNNGGTWCDSFGATFGAGNGQGTGVIPVDQSNAQLIGVRVGFCNGSGTSIIGFTCLAFQSCSLGMTIMNSLG